MADLVLNQTAATALFQGEKKIVTHYQNVSDSSGGTIKIIDVSALSATDACWLEDSSKSIECVFAILTYIY